MMTTQKSISEQVAELTLTVCSQQQLKMINDLRESGLLVMPTFNLAYGPVSLVNQSNHQ